MVGSTYLIIPREIYYLKVRQGWYLMKSGKYIYVFLFFQVSEEKMGDFRFWIESDASGFSSHLGQCKLQISCKTRSRIA